MDKLTEKQKQIVDKFRERYREVHVLVFQRMLEKAKNEVELFDILDTLPAAFPMAWDEENRRMVSVTEILKCGQIAN